MKITHDRLLEMLHYDVVTGIFTWKRKPNRNIRVGDVAGKIKPDGYVYVGVDGERYLGHRLAWFYVKGTWPSYLVDHRDTVKHHNAFKNLREADHSLNGANSLARKNNLTQIKGVSSVTNGKTFRARITVDRVETHLGTFDTKEEAQEAYINAAKEAFGEFHRP
jgi:hypothetical protein